MNTYLNMAERAKPEAAATLAHVLLRIYEAHRTDNCGLVNGEAILSQSFASEAEHALTEAGVLGATAAKPLSACPTCGCTDVQVTAWVYANTGLNTNDESPAEYAYCPQCDDSELRDRDLVDVEKPCPFDPKRVLETEGA